MKRVVLATAAGLAVFVGVYAAAAAMGLPSYALGAGNSSVASCDNAFTIDAFGYNGSGQITTVTVGDIASGCAGQLGLELTKADNSAIGHGVATVVVPSTLVTLDTPVSPTYVKHEVIIIVGP